jgi:hypothetical protein
VNPGSCEGFTVKKISAAYAILISCTILVPHYSSVYVVHVAITIDFKDTENMAEFAFKHTLF